MKNSNKQIVSDQNTLSPQKKLLFSVFLLAGLFLLFEGMAYISILLLQEKWGFYKPPERPRLATEDFDYRTYLNKRDPVLGWPSPQEYGGKHYTLDGAIPVPANEFIKNKDYSIALYGDSFTQAITSAVSAEQAWPNLLAKDLQLRVINFGVGGYGSDQAFIRFFDRGESFPAPIVILGHQAENITRNLTRYRDFTNYAKWYAFKPRFDIDNAEQLVRVPIPNLDEEEYNRFIGLSAPPLQLPYQNFGPMGRAGAVMAKFPFSYSLFKNIGYWRFKSKISGLSGYMQFYDIGHPFRGLDITEKIIKSFNNEAINRSQKPLIILFPGPADTKYFLKTKLDIFSELESRLLQSGIEVLNLNPLVVEYHDNNPNVTLYRDHHFGPELNQETANWIRNKLEELNWIDSL